MAKESVQYEFSNLAPNSNISIDGSWTQRRNSKTFILDVIDIATKKIIDFVLLDKGSKFRTASYHGASNMMESYGFKSTIQHLMSNKNIVGLVKDGDVKLEKAIKDNNWNIKTYLDPNHLKKNFHTIFAKYNKYAHGELKGFKKKILAHINTVLYSNNTPEEKRKLFLIILAFPRGFHSILITFCHFLVMGFPCVPRRSMAGCVISSNLAEKSHWAAIHILKSRGKYLLSPRLLYSSKIYTVSRILSTLMEFRL